MTRIPLPLQLHTLTARLSALPRPQLRRPSLGQMIDRAEAIERALSRTEEGHFRPVHWVFFAAVMLSVAYAPLLMHLPADFPYYQLPLPLAWISFLCLAHAVAKRKTAVLAEQLADGRLLWDLSRPHQGYTSVVTSLGMENGVPVTYVHGVDEVGKVSEWPLDGTLGGHHDHRAAVERAGYSAGGDE